MRRNNNRSSSSSLQLLLRAPDETPLSQPAAVVANRRGLLLRHLQRRLTLWRRWASTALQPQQLCSMRTAMWRWPRSCCSNPSDCCRGGDVARTAERSGCAFAASATDIRAVQRHAHALLRRDTHVGCACHHVCRKTAGDCQAPRACALRCESCVSVLRMLGTWLRVLRVSVLRPIRVCASGAAGVNPWRDLRETSARAHACARSLLRIVAV